MNKWIYNQIDLLNLSILKNQFGVGEWKTSSLIYNIIVEFGGGGKM